LSDLSTGPQRLSKLQGPIMLLNGHEGEIYSAQFSPDGHSIASAGFDMKIFMWSVYGDCDNYAVLKGHTGAVMQVKFSTDSLQLFTCSVDKTCRIWDLMTGACLRKLKGHQSFVNSIHPARRGPSMLVSASDDGTVKVWDTRVRQAVHSLQNTYQLTAVTFNDTAEQVISAGIDNDLKVWDLREVSMVYRMQGHADTVTGLSLSPDGNFVLSNSMDCSARLWDIRPFAPAQRGTNVFYGHTHNFEKNLLRCSWSADGTRVTCGSADRYVYVWNAHTGKIIYKLPGHQGSVNETDFHPTEPILMSAGSDKKIYLGEIQ